MSLSILKPEDRVYADIARKLAKSIVPEALLDLLEDIEENSEAGKDVFDIAYIGAIDGVLSTGLEKTQGDINNLYSILQRWMGEHGFAGQELADGMLAIMQRLLAITRGEVVPLKESQLEDLIKDKLR